MIDEDIFMEIDGNQVFHATELSKPYGENRKPQRFLRNSLSEKLIKEGNYFTKIINNGNPLKRGTWIDHRLYDTYLRWLKGETFGVKKEESFEYDYGKMLDEFFSTKIKRQHKMCSGKYRVDFYIPKFHLIIEYDEEQHFYNYKYDKIREEELKLFENNPLIFRCKKGYEIKSLKDLTIFLIKNNINIKNI